MAVGKLDLLLFGVVEVEWFRAMKCITSLGQEVPHLALLFSQNHYCGFGVGVFAHVVDFIIYYYYYY